MEKGKDLLFGNLKMTDLIFKPKRIFGIKKKILQLLGEAYLNLLTSMYILNKPLDLMSELQANPLNAVIRCIPTEPPKFSSFYQGDGVFFGADGVMQEK